MAIKRHDTPPEVARVLAKYAPKHISRLLEPSVGSGALLVPLKGRFSECADLVCVDVDPQALAAVENQYRSMLGDRLTLVNDDFLAWAHSGATGRTLFDCIIMNPPYSGRIADGVSLANLSGVLSEVPERSAPIEVAFVLAAIHLLAPRGRLLAVVPCSVACSTSTAWFRRLLLNFGSIHYVHEMPKGTFPGVEARVYLFVFEKGSTPRPLQLYNHDLQRPHRLTVDLSTFLANPRLDYRFHEAAISLSGLRQQYPSLQWTDLSSVATVHRGSVPSPTARSSAIHTHHYSPRGWRLDVKSYTPLRSSDIGAIHDGDILMKRVGRGCSSSVALGTPVAGYACSDCILIIRPNANVDPVDLLFALRCIYATESGGSLLERGTGAAYVTTEGMMSVSLPLALCSSYSDHRRAYHDHALSGDVTSMIGVEELVRGDLHRHSPSDARSECMVRHTQP